MTLVLTIVFAGFFSLFSGNPTAEVPISFWPLADGSRLSLAEEASLSAEIRRLDLRPYQRVAVQTRRDGARVGEIELYLLSRERYSAELVRMQVGRSGRLRPGDGPLPLVPRREGPSLGICPDPAVEVLLSSCEESLPSAMQALDTASARALAMGLRVAVLRGAEESRQALLDWYACPKLTVHGRVGHGLKDRIVLADGILSASDFSGLGPSALNGKALYFNSCLVHNPPLEPAVMEAGAQVYIGGNVELWIGPSEDVFTCWVERALSGRGHLQLLVSQCELDTEYLQRDAHGTTKDPYQPATLWLPLPAGSGPRARFTVGVRGRTVSFRDSSDTAARKIESWAWSFGDGATSGEPSPVHAYASEGLFQVTLTVMDGAKQKSSMSQQVAIDQEPGVLLLHGDTALEGLGGKKDSTASFKLLLPPGQRRLEVRLYGGYGDADLRVRRGAPPEDGTFDCASALTGNEESCTLVDPVAGSYYVSVLGGTYFGDVSILPSPQP